MHRFYTPGSDLLVNMRRFCILGSYLLANIHRFYTPGSDLLVNVHRFCITGSYLLIHMKTDLLLTFLAISDARPPNCSK